MARTTHNPKSSTPPKGRPTSRRSADHSTSPWADRWIAIQWILVGVAVVGVVAIAFYLNQGQDTSTVHGR
jgi:formate-dependent nitrite reductase membrane component NrfD